MTLSFLDWGVIAAYMVFALGIGFWFSAKASESTSEFFLSGRTLPWWILGTSMVATTFAADTPLAITEYVRTRGIWNNWFWWSVALQGMLAVFLFAPLWRRAEVMTDQELIELRYGGRPAAFLRGFKALYFSIVYNCIVMSWVIAGMTTVLAVVCQINQTAAILVCIAVALVYSVTSGFWGVVMTDLVQFVIAMFGSIALAIIAVRHVGGMGELLAKVEPLKAKIPHLYDFFPAMPGAGTPFVSSDFFKFLVFVTVMWWANQNADGGGYLIQRMAAAKDERNALLSSLWFNVCHYAIRLWPWVLVALVSLVLHPDLSAHQYGDKAAYPLVIADVLGSGMRGLLVVTFLAAFMSTIDTHLNWGASYLVNDLYRRFVRPEASEGHYVTVSKICVVVLMVMAGVSSLYVESISGMWEFVWSMGSGLGVVLILRWFWWRISAYSEITALASSLAVTLLLKLGGWLWPSAKFLGFALGNLPFHVRILIIMPVSLVCWLAVTFLTSPESDETLTAFCRRVNPGGWWGGYADASSTHRRILGFDAVINWVGGVVFVYSVTFGMGYAIFGQWYRFGLCAAAVLLSGAILWRTLARLTVKPAAARA